MVTKSLRVRLVGSNVITALIASLCCGGSLLFASIGLGGFFSALGLSRYVPQALAAGALSIAAVNYFVHHHLAACGACLVVAPAGPGTVNTVAGTGRTTKISA